MPPTTASRVTQHGVPGCETEGKATEGRSGRGEEPGDDCTTEQRPFWHSSRLGLAERALFRRGGSGGLGLALSLSRAYAAAEDDSSVPWAEVGEQWYVVEDMLRGCRGGLRSWGCDGHQATPNAGPRAIEASAEEGLGTWAVGDLGLDLRGLEMLPERLADDLRDGDALLLGTTSHALTELRIQPYRLDRRWP